MLDRIGIRLLDAQPGDTGWEIFSLDYMIDFPLSAIIHAGAVMKYRAAFHMLWRLKRVEWVLAGEFQHFNCIYAKHVGYGILHNVVLSMFDHCDILYCVLCFDLPQTLGNS